MAEFIARLVDRDGNPLGTAERPLKITGSITGGATSSIDIHTATEVATIASGDEVLIYDVSAEANRKITRENFIGNLSGHNYIINPCFEVNQRGVASVNLIWARPVDMWLITLDGATLTASQQTFTVGQIDVPGEPKNYLRCVVGAGSAAGDFASIQYRIEDVRTLAGQTVTLSFYAKADATKNISIALNQHFGTGGSPSATVYMHVEKLEISSIWDRYVVTFQMPSIAEKTIGTSMSGYSIFIIYLDAGTDRNVISDNLEHQSGTFEFANVKLEAGSVATPFRVPTYAEELAKCQRYLTPIFNRSSAFERGSGFCNAVSTTVCAIFIQMPVKMRTTPSLIAPANYTKYMLSDCVGYAILNKNPVVITGSSSPNIVCLQCEVASGLTQYRAYALTAADQTEDNMFLSAEL